MATEPTLRHLFPKDDGAPNTLDAAAIIRRSRARRLPKRLAIGSVTTLAVAGIVVASVQGLSTTTQMSASEVALPATGSTQDLSAASPAAGDGSGASETFGTSGGNSETFSSPGDSASATTTKRAPTELLNKCAAPLAEVSPNRMGLEVSVDFPATATIGDDPIRGTVTLTNAGTATVTGSPSRVPTVVLAKDGIVQWYTNGGAVALSADIPRQFAPGATREFEAFFWPVTCTPEDEADEKLAQTGDHGQPDAGFGTDLPRLAPGTYTLSVLMDFMGLPNDDLVSSPLTTITLK